MQHIHANFQSAVSAVICVELRMPHFQSHCQLFQPEVFHNSCQLVAGLRPHRVCLISTTCTYCSVCDCQGPSSLCSCWCGCGPCQRCGHPPPPLQSTLLLLLLGRHKLSGSESSAFASASYSYLSVTRLLQASENVVLTTLS